MIEILRDLRFLMPFVALVPILIIGPFNIIFSIYDTVTIILYVIQTIIINIFIPLLNCIVIVVDLLIKLLQVLAILLGIMSSLIIAGVFTCPSEDSFNPWLQSFLKFCMSNETNKVSNDSIIKFTWYEKILKDLQNYLFTAWAPFIMSKTIVKNPKFLHLGFCRLVSCESKNETLIFIGIFNTWCLCYTYKLNDIN